MTFYLRVCIYISKIIWAVKQCSAVEGRDPQSILILLMFGSVGRFLMGLRQVKAAQSSSDPHHLTQIPVNMQVSGAGSDWHCCSQSGSERSLLARSEWVRPADRLSSGLKLLRPTSRLFSLHCVSVCSSMWCVSLSQPVCVCVCNHCWACENCMCALERAHNIHLAAAECVFAARWDRWTELCV